MNNKKTILLFIAFVFMFASVNAATPPGITRHWVYKGVGSGLWSNSSNWSDTWGGTGGVSVPGPGDVVQFSGGGKGNCLIDVPVTVKGIFSYSDYGETIDLNGHDFKIAGDFPNSFTNITFNNSGATGSFIVNQVTPGWFIFDNITFDTEIDIHSSDLRPSNSTFKKEVNFNFVAFSNFHGNIFNDLATLETTSNWVGVSGGNTFDKNVTFINNGTGYYAIEATAAAINTYKEDVILENIGTGHIYFAAEGVGHHVNGNIITINSGHGATSSIVLCSTLGSELTVDGNVTMTQGGASPNIMTSLCSGGTITIDGDLSMTNSGTGTFSEMRISQNANTHVVINGKTTITNSGTASSKSIFYVGKKGEVVFNGDLALINEQGPIVDYGIYCGSDPGSNNEYNGDVTIINHSLSGVSFGGETDEVNFSGIPGGSGILAADKKITVSSGDFDKGNLQLLNFTQSLGTSQSIIVLTGSSLLQSKLSTWNGNLHFTAPNLLIEASVFTGTTILEKTGTLALTLNLANTYDDVTFINSGTESYIVGAVGTNTYTGDVNLKTTNTGNLFFTHNGSATNPINFSATSSSASPTTITIKSDQVDGLKIDGNADFTSSGGGNLTVELGGVAGNYSSLDIAGNMTIGSKVALDVRNSSKITVAGDFNNAGVFTIKSEGDGDADGFGDGDGSLITKGSITNTGNTIVERWTDPAKTWQLVSSPISDGLSGVFLGHYLNEYIIAEGDFKAIRPTTIPLGIGEGFVTKRAGLLGTNAPNPFLFQGTINGGTSALSPQVTLSEDVSGLADTDREFYLLDVKFNLIGNPYPSCLDWDDLYLANSTVVDAAYYRYNDAGDGNGSWVPNLASDPNESIINIGQGFGVVWSGGAFTFTLSNDARTHDKGTGFSKKSSITSDRFDLIASSNGLSDNVNFRFNEGATFNYDGKYDAYKFDSFGDTPTPSFISVDNRNLAICQQPKSESVDLGFKMAVSGEVIFSLSNVNNFSEIVLEDKETGDFVDLTKTTYTFTYSDSEEEIGRFTLHFKQETLSDIDELENLNIYSSNSSLYIKSDKRLSNVDVSIYNVSGQEVFTKYFEGLRDEEIKTELKGMYVLKLTSDKGAYTSKLILK